MERFQKLIANSKSSLVIFAFVCTLFGGWLQFAYVGGWDHFWVQAEKFQTLIAGSLILITAIVAFYNSQAHINAQDKQSKDDRYIQRKNIAGSASALAFTAARILRTNCGVLQESLGSPLEPIYFNAYEIILPDIKVLHSEQAREFIRLFEFMRSRNAGTQYLHKEIQEKLHEYQIKTPTSDPKQIHEYINSISYINIPVRAEEMMRLSVAFENLKNWLEDYSGGGKKLSRDEAQKKFGSFEV